MKKKAALVLAAVLLTIAVLCPAFYAAEYDADGYEVLEDVPEYQDTDVSYSDEVPQATQSIENRIHAVCHRRNHDEYQPEAGDNERDY